MNGQRKGTYRGRELDEQKASVVIVFGELLQYPQEIDQRKELAL